MNKASESEGSLIGNVAPDKDYQLIQNSLSKTNHPSLPETNNHLLPSPVEEVMEDEEKEHGIEDQDLYGGDALLDYVPVPPDGGWGWMVVFASFMANLVVDGISYSFGIFLTEFQDYYSSTQGLTAMVGSLLTGCYLVAGPVVGGLVNKYGSRSIMMVGAFIGMGGFFASVWAPTLTILMISYGIVGGIGFGFIYLPAIVHVGYYFEKKRALATGIAVAGSGVGTFIFAPLSVALLEEYSWKGSLWILAGLILNCAVFGALLRPLKSKRNPKELKIQVQGEAESLKNVALSHLSLAGDSMLSLTACDKQRSNLGPFLGVNRECDLQKLARIRSALSECSAPEDDNHDFLGSTPSKFSVLKEELLGHRQKSNGIIHEAQTPTPSPGFPKISITTADGSPRPFRSPSAPRAIPVGAEMNGSIEMGKDLRVETHKHARPTSRMSARSYVASLQQLNSMSTVAAAMSSQNLANVNPEDFGRPLYRQDIFYGGSIQHLPEYYEGSDRHLGTYLQSTISVPRTLDFIEEEPQERGPEFWSWVPGPIRFVFCEMIDLKLLREPVMILLCLSNIFGMLGFYCPFVFLNNRAEEYGVRASEASFLLSIIGITNTVGRVVFGLISDRGWVSALTINNGCLLSCGILTLVCPFFTTYASMAAYSAAFGFLISAYISLTSIILVDYLGLDRLTNSFGLLILSRGVSAIAGSPLAGAVYDATKSYNHSFYVAGSLIFAAGLVSCAIPFVYKLGSCTTGWSKSPSPKILCSANNDCVLAERNQSVQLINEQGQQEITSV